MAEKQCNLDKNGGGSGIVRLDYSNAERIIANDSIAIDTTGRSYTATKAGAIVCNIRLGTNSTIKTYVNEAEVSNTFTADTTAATSTSGPVYTLPLVFVDGGDVFEIKRTWGNYAWLNGAYFIPYK